jgi:hypothetical protein
MLPKLYTLEDLKALPPLKPPQGAGGYWKGVEHYELSQLVVRACEGMGMSVIDSAAVLGNCNRDMVMSLRIDNVRKARSEDDWDFLLCVENNNSRRRKMQWLAGVCDHSDLMVVTYQNGRRKKHTYGLSPLKEMEKSVVELEGVCGGLYRQVLQLKSRPLTTEQSDLILMGAGRKGALPFSRVGEASAFFGASEGKTAWDLCLAYSKASKKNPPMKMTQQAYDFFQCLKENQS